MPKPSCFWPKTVGRSYLYDLHWKKVLNICPKCDGIGTITAFSNPLPYTEGKIYNCFSAKNFI